MFRRFALLLLFFAPFAAVKAHAAEDRVSFLNNITIQPGENVGDAVCFLCSIRNQGVIHGDAVAFLGSIKTTGNIEGDLVSFLGGADIAADVTINGDCVVFGGNIERHGNGQINGSQVSFPFAIFLIPLIFLFAVIWGIRALVLRSRSAYATPPPR